MAKLTLPTNFRDDIMNDSMGGKRRYNLIQNSDGTVSLEDATSYTQVGSDFGAAQVNATNTAVNESADKNKIIESLDDIAANTQHGMIAGALAVAELNSKCSETNSYVPDKEIEIGTFYDGRPLYQQVKTFNNIAFTNGSEFAHGIANVDMLYIHQAFLIDKNGNYGRSVPITESNGNVAGFRASRTVLRCIGNGSWDASAARTWIFVLRYTKL